MMSQKIWGMTEAAVVSIGFCQKTVISMHFDEILRIKSRDLIEVLLNAR